MIDLKALKRRANKARNFPINTDPCSRTLILVADALTSKQRKHAIEECYEPEVMAEAMYATVTSLWELRTMAAKGLLPRTPALGIGTKTKLGKIVGVGLDGLKRQYWIQDKDGDIAAFAASLVEPAPKG